MPGKIRLRSGNAVTEYCKLIGFNPTSAVFVGVGMNHAEVGLIKDTWPQCDIIGFEPNPSTFESIKSDFPGKLYNVAIAGDFGEEMLFFRSRNRDGGSLFIPEGAGHKTERVIVETIDICGLKSPGSLLWLDCEGSELDALSGGDDFIKKNFDVINIEMTGIPRGEGWPTPLSVHCKLKKMGYYQAWIHTTRSVRGQFDAIYVKPHLLKPEYCCCLESLLETR